MRKVIILFFIVAMSLSCSTRKRMSVLNYFSPTTEEVKVMGAGQIVPEKAVMVGFVSVGEKGLTAKSNCTFEKVIHDAKQIAQQMGGNIIFIISHREPDSNSTCHEIKANVYRLEE